MTIRKTTIYGALLLLALFCVSMIGCGGKQSLSNLSARELFDLGKEKYDDGDYFRATEIFQSVIYDFPGETLIDTAQYYLALSYYGNDDYILGRVEFIRLINYYPASVFAPHSVFMRAVCLFEGAPEHHALDQTEVYESITEFEDFIIDFPESGLLPDVHAYLNKARSRLAKKDYDAGIVYFRMHAYKAARIYFQKVIDEFTTTAIAGSALYYLGEMDLETGMYDDAARRFDSFLKLHKDHEFVPKAIEKQAEAAFMAAKVHYDNGDMEAARTALKKFMTDYPDSDPVDDANKLVKKISESSPESTNQDS